MLTGKTASSLLYIHNTRDTFISLFMCVRPLSNVEKAKQKFAVEDKNNNNRVDMAGFIRLSDIILTKVKSTVSKQEKMAADYLTFPRIRRLVDSR